MRISVIKRICRVDAAHMASPGYRVFLVHNIWIGAAVGIIIVVAAGNVIRSVLHRRQINVVVSRVLPAFGGRGDTAAIRINNVAVG